MDREKKTLVPWISMDTVQLDAASISERIMYHAITTLARDSVCMDIETIYEATSLTIREHMIENWSLTQYNHKKHNCKRVYYLSIEYLLGRLLNYTLMCYNITSLFKDALNILGYDLDDVLECEKEASLGNGGLGRLASCIMESMATESYPGWGYGLRYTYGMFKQKIIDGYQKEYPENWQTRNPWEIERKDIIYPISFYGHVDIVEKDGKKTYNWVGDEIYNAMAYDILIVGYRKITTVAIRLWETKPLREFNMAVFNKGGYVQAVKESISASTITNVLYPNDNNKRGQILRLKQEYCLASASIQDIIHQFKKQGEPFEKLPDFVAIQINDTHPAIAIPEMMRILIDEESLDDDQAWSIVQEIFNYTNHTIMSEALETWSVMLIEELLPRHMQIIYDINHRYLEWAKSCGFENDTIREISIIEEGEVKHIRMMNLAFIGSKKVNGVSKIHCEILKKTIFKYFHQVEPKKLLYITNGASYTRWIRHANPQLNKIYNKMAQMKTECGNIFSLASELADAKTSHKKNLANFIKKNYGTTVGVDCIFVVHAKRFHEYKRQLMAVIGIIWIYKNIKNKSFLYPSVFIFAGKAAPGYYLMKLLIKLISMISTTIKEDDSLEGKLDVIFLPNYNVELAERILPAADVTLHISLSGTEAAGTSNIKSVMNGGAIVGTVDGSTVEIQSVCPSSVYSFGYKVDEIEILRSKKEAGSEGGSAIVSEVLEMIRSGAFGDATVIEPLLESVEYQNDEYLIHADIEDYIRALKDCYASYYIDKARWNYYRLVDGYKMKSFSTNIMVQKYATEVWNVSPKIIE